VRRLSYLALAWVALVLGLLAIHVLLPQRSGTIALTEVFEPYVLLSGLIACVVGAWSDLRIGRTLVLVFVVLSIARCGPVVVSNPGPGYGERITVMTWNMEAGPDAGQRVLRGVSASQADLIALEEFQPDAQVALEADPELARRFPHRVFAADRSVRGVALLSTFLIVESQTYHDPPLLRAVIKPSLADPIAVFVVHPLPASFVSFLRLLPVALDTTVRDADITFIRSLIDADLAAGRDVIVLGDINTTEREPAYFDLSAGLHDAHLDAGIGPGFTWRPPQLSSLPFGLLRIDYAFASQPFVIDTVFTDCSLPSDHCRLEATIHTGAQL
jgi:vancomycin resistance protein VanJ